MVGAAGMLNQWVSSMCCLPALAIRLLGTAP